MSQRIEVRSVVKKDGKILLLKRSSSQEGLQGNYELPGGRVDLTEQPEDSVKRLLKETTGLEAQTIYLSDVFTYTSQEDRTTQSAVIVYEISVAGSGDIQMSSKYSRYAWKRVSDVPEDELTELSRILLDAYRSKLDIVPDIASAVAQNDVGHEVKTRSEFAMYSDGGSRGNPGPSAAGYIIKDGGGNLAYEGGAYLGITTNNQAEYHGVRLGLERAKEMGAKSVDCYIDSLLVVNQLNGQYVIRNRELWPIHERIKELIGQFDKVTFRHIKREFNQQADGMVNKILDTRSKKDDVKI